MNKAIPASLLTVLLSVAVASGQSDQPRYSMKPAEAARADAERTYEDIRATLGIVPGYLRDYPQESITGAWQETKSIQLSANTAIPARYKELIGLGVAAQVPCHYCSLFHTEAARFNGATNDEVKEAIAVASVTRHWATFLEGIQYDDSKFRAEADAIFSRVKAQRQQQDTRTAAAAPAAINNAADAYKDMELTMGLVPEFVKAFPEEGIAGVWQDVKSTILSQQTAVPIKYKDLIGLGVSAQIPCQKCVYWDTQAARAHGATDKEIAEAVAMASITRRWSTVLNGLNTDQAVFKNEMGQIIAHLTSAKTGNATR